MIGGSSPGRGWKFFSSPLPGPDRLWDPPSLLPNGYQGYFPWGIKRQGREADHSPPSSAEVNNAWSYTSTPPIRLHGEVLSLKKGTGTTLPLSFYCYPPTYAQVSQVVSSLQVSRPKFCMYFSSLPYELHVPPTSSSLT
jgi:hypothetical protein